MTKSQRRANYILCLIIFLVIGLGIKRAVEAPDLFSLLNPPVRATGRFQALEDQVILDRVDVSIDRVRSTLDGRLTITNKTRNDLFDVVIHCALRDRAGNYWGSNQWIIHDTVPVGTTHQFEVAARRYVPAAVSEDTLSCAIIDLKLKEASLAQHGEGSH